MSETTHTGESNSEKVSEHHFADEGPCNGAERGFCEDFRINEPSTEPHAPSGIRLGGFVMSKDDLLEVMRELCGPDSDDGREKGESQPMLFREICTVTMCSTTVVEIAQKLEVLKDMKIDQGQYKGKIGRIMNSIDALLREYMDDCVNPYADRLVGRTKDTILKAGIEPDWKEVD